MEREEGQLKARDGQRGVGLSVPLCLLQPVPLLQHVMYVLKLCVSELLYGNSCFKFVCLCS